MSYIYKPYSSTTAHIPPVQAHKDEQALADELALLPDEFQAQFRERLRGLVRTLLEQTMQEEMEAFLGAKRGECGQVGRQGYRNGYYQRDLVTSEGKICDLRVPRDRGGEFKTQTFERYERYQPEIVEAAQKMFVSGVSQGKVGPVLQKLTGVELSQSAVSRMSRSIEAAVEEWLARPLATQYKVVYLDGVYFPIRHGDKADQTAVLVALGVGLDGYKEVLGMRCAAQESKEGWQGLLEDIHRRGATNLELVVTDGGDGLLAALPQVYPQARRQRCITHKMRNVLAHIPTRAKKEVGQALSALFAQPTQEKAQAHYEAVLARYERVYPQAARSLQEDWAACLTYYEFEPSLQRYIKTTNALESLFSQVRSRTHSMKLFQDEGSCLMMVGATMQGVKFQKIPV